MAHQYMPKIFHGPHKKPLAHLLHTYCTVPYIKSTNIQKAVENIKK